MGGEVESVSCEIKCMLKCGGLLVPENTCIEPCMRAQCHKPPSPLSKSSTDDAIERRNMKEVEGLSCWDKCMFLCGLSLSSQKTCTDKCVREILLASQNRWLNAQEVRSLFMRYDQFTLSTTDPPVNTTGLHFYQSKKFTNNEKDYVRKNGNRRTQSSKKLIFSKLRNLRDVILCKSVSKRWKSLLSSSSSFHNTPSLALILSTNPQCATNDICLESGKGFKLRSYLDPEFDSPVSVLASYKDLLLCMKKAHSWIKIEHFPSRLSWKSRYYVVMMLESTPSMLRLGVFDSEFGNWNFNFLEYPPWSQSVLLLTQSQLPSLD
ncbi:hypothetical protein ISN44_As03g039530 [Arabidopsis suecica]|uniref:F-box family protein n=1 Tax=Arabidopsis suecica TaxID=45249 RepID=A0A8T2FBK7_ARASU|nr:hypothetical protein ISN44_As03g039530 [Arabidopsis suecica]